MVVNVLTRYDVFSCAGHSPPVESHDYAHRTERKVRTFPVTGKEQPCSAPHRSLVNSPTSGG